MFHHDYINSRVFGKGAFFERSDKVSVQCVFCLFFVVHASTTPPYTCIYTNIIYFSSFTHTSHCDLMKLHIKPTAGGEKLEVEIDGDKTVLELKEEVASKVNMSAGEIRLVWRGQILRDERTLENYGERISMAVWRL